MDAMGTGGEDAGDVGRGCGFCPRGVEAEHGEAGIVGKLVPVKADQRAVGRQSGAGGGIAQKRKDVERKSGVVGRIDAGNGGGKRVAAGSPPRSAGGRVDPRGLGKNVGSVQGEEAGREDFGVPVPDAGDVNDQRGIGKSGEVRRQQGVGKGNQGGGGPLGGHFAVGVVDEEFADGFARQVVCLVSGTAVDDRHVLGRGMDSEGAGGKRDVDVGTGSGVGPGGVEAEHGEAGIVGQFVPVKADQRAVGRQGGAGCGIAQKRKNVERKRGVGGRIDAGHGSGKRVAAGSSPRSASGRVDPRGLGQDVGSGQGEEAGRENVGVPVPGTGDADDQLGTREVGGIGGQKSVGKGNQGGGGPFGGHFAVGVVDEEFADGLARQVVGLVSGTAVDDRHVFGRDMDVERCSRGERNQSGEREGQTGERDFLEGCHGDCLSIYFCVNIGQRITFRWGRVKAKRENRLGRIQTVIVSCPIPHGPRRDSLWIVPV